MFLKMFQFVMVSLVVIFTTGAAILILFGVTTLLLTSTGHSGLFTYSFAVRRETFQLLVGIMLLVILSIVFLVTRRNKLR